MNEPVPVSATVQQAAPDSEAYDANPYPFADVVVGHPEINDPGPYATVTVYQDHKHEDVIVVDVLADFGQKLVITLNDGDVWRGPVPQ